MTVESDGYQFNFTDAIDAFKFDETNRTKPTFHGAPMKAVDIIAELDSAYIFIEIKEFDNPSDYNESEYLEANDESIYLSNMSYETKHNNFTWLKNYLKYKYRYTFLYRYAEQKLNKPIHYICILNFDNALNNYMAKNLKRELPTNKVSVRWTLKLAESCQVMDIKKWNESFPKWPAKKL